MKAVVAAFNQGKALVGAFSVITNLRMELFEALLQTRWVLFGGYCGGYTILERLQLFTEMFSEPNYITRPCLVSTYISFYIIEIPTVIAASKGKVSDIEEFI